jgi:hypothetical protein
MHSFSWRQRHIHNARAIKGGEPLLRHAVRPEVLQEQRRIVEQGGKPVLAYSAFIATLGLVGRELDILKRFAGEIAAFAVETAFGAVRAPGSKLIAGDPVFVSAQPFRLAAGGGTQPSAPGRFLRALAALIDLAEVDELRGARDLIERRLVSPAA